VAALETLELLEEGLIENARQVGSWILDELNRLKERYEIIGDVRGKGLMIGLEIVKNKKTKAADPDRRNDIIRKAYRKGLLLLECGTSSIRICPPLVLSLEEAELGLSILKESIEEVAV
jgi:4-aminobutyrate aminotransferase